MQGCGHPKFLPTLRQYLRDNKSDVVGLVEPCISGLRADRVIHHVVSPTLIALKHRDSHEVFGFAATLIYGSPNASKRKPLWSNVSSLASNINQPWLLFGYFNATLSTDDRMGCAPSTKPCSTFRQLLFELDLRDMGFSGQNFTWHRGLVHARLDHFLCNTYWDQAFPESLISHLLRMRSDHWPMLLQVGHLPSHSSKTLPILRLYSCVISMALGIVGAFLVCFHL
ncbi:hypothetical protein GQ457_09G030820 [Hibiscus cannabinus]